MSAVLAPRPTPALIPFRVTIKNGKREVRGFEAMGSDSVTVAEQHQSLCEPGSGEYIDVMPLDKWRARLAAMFAGPEDFRQVIAQNNVLRQTRGDFHG